MGLSRSSQAVALPARSARDCGAAAWVEAAQLCGDQLVGELFGWARDADLGQGSVHGQGGDAVHGCPGRTGQLTWVPGGKDTGALAVDDGGQQFSECVGAGGQQAGMLLLDELGTEHDPVPVGVCEGVAHVAAPSAASRAAGSAVRPLRGTSATASYSPRNPSSATAASSAALSAKCR
jgi:hypothetical protein